METTRKSDIGIRVILNYVFSELDLFNGMGGWVSFIFKQSTMLIAKFHGNHLRICVTPPDMSVYIF